jgi:hypothetical protein
MIRLYLIDMSKHDNRELLGDSRTTPRGTALTDWITENGIRCWNAELAFGVPTYTIFRNYSPNF